MEVKKTVILFYALVSLILLGCTTVSSITLRNDTGYPVELLQWSVEGEKLVETIFPSREYVLLWAGAMPRWYLSERYHEILADYMSNVIGDYGFFILPLEDEVSCSGRAYHFSIETVARLLREHGRCSGWVTGYHFYFNLSQMIESAAQVTRYEIPESSSQLPTERLRRVIWFVRQTKVSSAGVSISGNAGASISIPIPFSFGALNLNIGGGGGYSAGNRC